MEATTKGATKNVDGNNAEKKRGDEKEIENVKDKEECSKVDMAGFTFYANACEKKLNLFLEDLFSNKKIEDLYYAEEKSAAENNSKKKQKEPNAQNAEDADEEDDDDDDEESTKNLFERNVIKSNYDKMAINLVEEVEQFMKPFVNDRYKIVVQGVIGENKKQGVHIASKSLWNVETDNYVSAKYVNDYIFVTVMVFLLYNE